MIAFFSFLASFKTATSSLQIYIIFNSFRSFNKIGLLFKIKAYYVYKVPSVNRFSLIFFVIKSFSRALLMIMLSSWSLFEHSKKPCANVDSSGSYFNYVNSVVFLFFVFFFWGGGCCSYRHVLLVKLK